jgi:anti-sigma factor RsiW
VTTFTGHLSDAQAQRLLDGALLPAEAAETEAHVAGCAECQALVESFAALSDALAGLEVPALPSDFTAGVLEVIETRERAVVRERRFAAAVCGAALVTIVGVALWLLGATSWAPSLTAAVDQLGTAGRALRVAADVVPPVVSALRVQIAAACAALVLPLLFALSRLMTPSPRTELA